MRLRKAVAKLFAQERVCRVATAGKSGLPHLVPVCAVVVDGKVCFGSGKDGRKILNLRENPQVALTVDLYSDDWDHLKGAMIQGDARVVAPGPRFRRIRARLYAKYLQYPAEAALGDRDSVVVEVTPTHVFTWGLD